MNEVAKELQKALERLFVRAIAGPRRVLCTCAMHIGPG